MTNEQPISKAHPRARGRITLVTFITLLAFVLFIIGFMIFPYLLALAVGLMLALLTFPLYRQMIKYRNYPHIAAAILTVGMILLAVIPISAFTYLAIKQGMAVASSLIENKEF